MLAMVTYKLPSSVRKSIMPVGFEKPVETVCGRVTLCPKRISEDSMSDRTYCTDGTAITIGLLRSLKDVPYVHQLPPKPLVNPFLEALQDSTRERCNT